LLEEIEKEKNMTIKKKMEEKEALQRTLVENEENKKKQLENLRIERLNDVRSAEEYGKVLDKQENERKLYFKNMRTKPIITCLK